MAKQAIPVKEGSDNGEDPAVVAKVDEMMDLNLPEQPSEPLFDENQKVSQQTAPITKPLPTLDIFSAVSGPPDLVESKKPKTKKIKIQLEQTESGNQDIPVAVAPSQPPEVTVSKNDPPLPSDTEPVELLVSNSDKELPPADFDAPKPDDFDDPKTAAAINDILARESDTLLQAQDPSPSAARTAKVENDATEEGSHRIFWSLVFVVCLIAIAMAVFLIDPAIHNPLSKINWSAIRRHL
jgi:hypothetical protein